MNLLLLLSALLSALTGVAGSRAEPAPRAMCAQVADTQAAPVSVAPSRRPGEPLPSLTQVRFAAVPALILIASAPLYASRRRE